MIHDRSDFLSFSPPANQALFCEKNSVPRSARGKSGNKKKRGGPPPQRDLCEQLAIQTILTSAPTTAIPYVTYDRLSEVDEGAIVENKRLSHALQIVLVMQEQLDSRRGRSAPARAKQGLAPCPA